MECFFYCTYAHSAKGFFLTRLKDNALCPAEGNVPKAVRDFFSYERFRFLWKDLAVESERTDAGKYRPDAAFCGVSYLRGTMSDGRQGIANVAFLASVEERALLQNVALNILGDYAAFEARVLRWLSTGGDCGYELDAEQFSAWLNRCGEAEGFQILTHFCAPSAWILRFLTRRVSFHPKEERIYFAVYVGDWKRIAKAMDSAPYRLRNPIGILSEKLFKQIFCAQGAVWEMKFLDEKRRE